MSNLQRSVLVLLLLGLALGCQSATLEIGNPTIRSTTIADTGRPASFDRSTTYHYRLGRVIHARDLLIELWDDGLRT